MNFKQVYNKTTKSDEIFLGYRENELCKINIVNDNSIIVTGSSGTSKSVLMNQILLQLIKNFTSEELNIICINPTKVELKPYEKTSYSLKTDEITDENKYHFLNQIVNERLDVLKESKCATFADYNLKESKKLPYLVIAIDEASKFLKTEEDIFLLNKIMGYCDILGIILIIDTNDIHNDFFKKDFNVNAKCRISFDFISEEDSILNNLNQSNKLMLKEFIIHNKDYNDEKFKSFEFDDSIISKTL